VFQLSPFGLICRLRQLAPGILVVYMRNMLQHVLPLLLHRRKSLVRGMTQSEQLQYSKQTDPAQDTAQI